MYLLGVVPFNNDGFSEVNMIADLVYWDLQHRFKDTSPDPDMLHSTILWEVLLILVTLVGMVFSNSLSRRTFLDNCKLVHIDPSLEGGRRSKPSGYMPVALLLTPSKVIESRIYYGQHDHLIPINLFWFLEHGFR